MSAMPCRGLRALAIATSLSLASFAAAPHSGDKDTYGCHDRGAQWYAQTIHFEPFNTLRECLDSGGRLPKD